MFVYWAYFCFIVCNGQYMYRIEKSMERICFSKSNTKKYSTDIAINTSRHAID